MKSVSKLARTITMASFALGLLAAAAIPAIAQDYDLVILNGRVMDPETKYDKVANVGVKGGRIAVITENLSQSICCIQDLEELKRDL